MPDNNGNPPRGVHFDWQILFGWQILAIAVAIIGQFWFFASQQGAIESDLTSADRRIGSLETIGSPGVGL